MADQYSAKFDEARFDYSYFNRIFGAYSLDAITKLIQSRDTTFDILLHSSIAKNINFDSVIEQFAKVIKYNLETILEEMQKELLKLDTLIQSTTPQEIEFDSLLKKREQLKANIDSILKIRRKSKYLIDSILLHAVKSEYRYDTLLERTRGLGVDMDTFFSYLAAVASMDLNTLLLKRQEIDNLFDIIFEKTVSDDEVIDTLLSKADIRTPYTYDILLDTYKIKNCKLSSILESEELRHLLVDILTSLVSIKDLSLDAIIEQLGISKDMVIDSFLKRLGIPIQYKYDFVASTILDKHHLFDALVKEFKATRFAVDSVLEVSAEADYSVDVFLSTIGLRKEFSFSLILSKAEQLEVVLFDALLEIVGIKYLPMNVMLQTKSSRKLLMDIIAGSLLSREITMNILLKESFSTSLIFDTLFQFGARGIDYTISSLFGGVVKRVLRTSVRLSRFLFIDEIKTHQISIFDISASTSPLYTIRTSMSPVLDVVTSHISP